MMTDCFIKRQYCMSSKVDQQKGLFTILVKRYDYMFIYLYNYLFTLCLEPGQINRTYILGILRFVKSMFKLCCFKTISYDCYAFYIISIKYQLILYYLYIEQT